VALSPLFAGWLFSHPSLISVPFFIAGTLKIAYDVLLFRAFRGREATRRSDHYLNGNSFTT